MAVRLIHMSDIHGDFEILDRSLEVVVKSKPDVLAITGDLSGEVFNKEETGAYLTCYNEFDVIHSQVMRVKEGFIGYHDAAQSLIRGELNASDGVRDVARKYLEFEMMAEGRKLAQYREFKKRFDSLDSKIILVPGNWDIVGIDEVLAEENIHCKTKARVNELGFAGYGGSSDHPNVLPLDLCIPFSEDEGFIYLNKQTEGEEGAEVILTHECPRGSGGDRHGGSWWVSALLYKTQPSLFLFGHSHYPILGQDDKSQCFISSPAERKLPCFSSE